MFWSKLWLFLITLAAGLAAALALLAPRPLDRDLEQEAGARLTQAQQAAFQLLKINARRWMDTAAQVAADAVLVESLDQASSPRGPADLTLVHRTVQDRLHHFNNTLKVDLLVATDVRGRVIARAGLEEGEYRDFIDGFPLVGDALRGLRGDDTWSLGGKLYRVAASPVIARDKYAGALVVGQEVGSELAQSMKQVLELDVAFLLRGRVLASSTQSQVVQKLPMLPPLNDDKQLVEMQRVGHSPPLSVEAPSEDKPYLVMLAPFVGEASGHKATFALLLPRPGAPPLGAMLQGLIQPSELKSLPWMSLAPIGGGLIIALVLGLVLMRLEADRPLKRMAREAQALARGEIARLDDDKHPGKLGTVARAVNTTLDRLASTRGPQPLVRNPDAVLRAAGPAGLSGPTAFGPGNPEPPIRTPTPKTPLPPAAPPPPSPSMSGQGMFAEPSDSGTDGGSLLTGPSISRPTVDLRPVGEVKPTLDFRPAVRKPAPPSPSPSPSPSDGEYDAPPTGEGSVPTSPKMQLQPLGDTDAQPTHVPMHKRDEGPDMVDAPELLPALHSSALPALPTQPDARGFYDEVTTSASSAGLLAKIVAQEKQIAEKEHLPPPTSPAEGLLEAELRQVYHDFIETKQRLGEPTEGVTYDKFVVKLRANRQQLITRYGCKSVKFQVYVKDGKAALKATPVSA